MNAAVNAFFLIFKLLSLYFLAVSLFCLCRRKKPAASAGQRRFAILIAARNEESCIAGLIESLQAQRYPRELFDIWVLPNNCTDHTVEAAQRAIRAGYQSVMIDGSRLPLEENISATREAADLAHAAQIPCEAELGAVMGHENKVMPPYEEIFASKMGFTRLDEAKRFAEESKCDWLSVAVGNIHGAVAEAVRNQKKPEAKIDVAHVAELYRAAGIPLVLHGGSGIQHQYILDAISAGIAKINVGTELRQTYEFALQESGNDVSFAQDALYKRTRAYIADYLFNTNLKDFLFG